MYSWTQHYFILSVHTWDIDWVYLPNLDYLNLEAMSDTASLCTDIQRLGQLSDKTQISDSMYLTSWYLLLDKPARYIRSLCNAPINVMPHYPHPGHYRGQGGDLTNKLVNFPYVEPSLSVKSLLYPPFQVGK